MAGTAVSITPELTLLPSVFGKLGLVTVADLLLHFPLRYEDETRLTPIEDVQPGRFVQIQGEIVQRHAVLATRRLEVWLRDESGDLLLRFLHAFPGQAARMVPGVLLRVAGEARVGFSGLEMLHPRWRAIKPGTPLPDGLTPVYPAVAGVTQSALRRQIRLALAQIDWQDTLPEQVLQAHDLPDFFSSVRLLHHPSPETSVQGLQARTHAAWRRIKFDELLAQQLSLRQARAQRQLMGAPRLVTRSGLVQRLLDALPFALTSAQRRAWQQIQEDMQQSRPMQRLLQGDVGSGKTVVAALAAAQAIDAGYQVAFMVPTELLAEQHFQKLVHWFAPLQISVGMLSGSLGNKARNKVLEALRQGELALVVGTHALFQREVSFARPGLLVVDEQHRFGVAQRMALRDKGVAPHQLMMSATPIPRTLAMTYYADLDVSVIDALPPARSPVRTRLVDDRRRQQVMDWVRQRTASGEQVYWVCPLIEESEALQLQTAMDTYAALCLAWPDSAIGLVHGRMRAAEKQAVMADFVADKLRVLVATTVIEVGVDVPNASVMVVEHAERMGLAQLHQLRGRVGRGMRRSECVLLYHEPLSDLARARLKIMFESQDGFHIAREDLRLRGPGEFIGARQSGVPVLRFANPDEDTDLMQAVCETAEYLLQHEPGRAQAHIARWYGARQSYAQA